MLIVDYRHTQLNGSLQNNTLFRYCFYKTVLVYAVHASKTPILYYYSDIVNIHRYTSASLYRTLMNYYSFLMGHFVIDEKLFENTLCSFYLYRVQTDRRGRGLCL